MTLLQLPPELLLLVLGHLGSAFFAQDLRRLTVCKRWYDLAWRVFARELRLTEKSLSTFTDDDAALRRCQPYIATVQLLVEDLSSSPMVAPAAPRHPPPMLEGDGWLSRWQFQAAVDEWRSQFRASVSKLATTLRRSPALRSLEFKSRNLTTEPLQDRRYEERSSPHLCCEISTLLPSLRQLRCRMGTICEHLLEPPPAGTPLALEEVIVNLTIPELSDTYTAYHLSRRCDTPDTVLEGISLVAAMEKKAAALAARMQHPRMVRVISHNLPSLHVYAFDGIKGQKVQLHDNINWDAEGERVDEGQSNDSEEDNTDLFEDDSPVAPFIVL
ncbi:hypothetical protein N658DRAFT_43065 [Parathielavia hyrcaniae]|uniref:F-box domain-containing protein n=1 Tax=Parathielavia hyrcaniae TaxID=113614 RepID=A0AAN6T2S7_9PEZI|nr:hypothetical protein N658DRAFT_43065 [Parathielavia hyrcaniae]